jgi:hypothetical protein
LGERVSVFATLVAQAGQVGLPFLVIGGNAVIAYGYPRQTHDFDFLVDNRHRFRWDQIIRELGYHPEHFHSVFQMYKCERPEHPPIDLMLVDHDTFQKFENDAIETIIHQVPVRIPALLHMIALKLHAEKSAGDRREGRDFNDVLMLLKLNHVELADPALQEILERFGNEDIRRRLSIFFEKG